jgi:general stress protein 26
MPIAVATGMTADKKRFLELVKQFRTAMLVTSTEDGHLRGRPMAVARVDDDGTLYFVSALETEKVEDILEHAQSAVTLQGTTSFLSISGRCLIRRDERLLDELWTRDIESSFDGSKDASVIIQFEPEHAEYWNQELRGLNFALEAAVRLIRREGSLPQRRADHGRVNLH